MEDRIILQAEKLKGCKAIRTERYLGGTEESDIGSTRPRGVRSHVDHLVTWPFNGIAAAPWTTPTYASLRKANIKNSRSQPSHGVSSQDLTKPALKTSQSQSVRGVLSLFAKPACSQWYSRPGEQALRDAVAHMLHPPDSPQYDIRLNPERP
ncbi:hypothetical protein PGTUg99_024202 [Puccinia graminis f. sp. tritici]|uniref:Uncharacterized protein n=1 Tax=Puccinia graminis f. sp. tritici TaxID=56615 RepID=A0A5B0RYL4_PUCGR|nr:hypothetical protein PGTUg99_024202 [Puccinia graminis f. sp. tritici]